MAASARLGMSLVADETNSWAPEQGLQLNHKVQTNTRNVHGQLYARPRLRLASKVEVTWSSATNAIELGASNHLCNGSPAAA